MTMTPVRGTGRQGLPDTTELLIKEARQKMLRRRLRIAVVALIVLVAAIAIWQASGGITHPVSPLRVHTSSPKNGSPSGSSNLSALPVLGGQTLFQISPTSADDLWIWSQNQVALTGGGQDIELTTNGGRTWTNVTPPGLTIDGGRHWINGFFALSSTRAWLVYGGVDKGPQTIETTSDAGRHWSKVGVMPSSGCSLQFVSPADGTCTVYAGAMGSMGIAIYRTSDGGRRWSNIFNSDMTQASLNESTPVGSLPFGCDKRIPFTSATTGWALFLCAGGAAPIYESTNGGVTWVNRSAVPASPMVVGGAGFSGTPVFSGSRGAVAYTGGSYSLVYVSDNNGQTFRPVYPPGTRRTWSVNILSPLQWRLAYKNVILSTNNGGKSWIKVVSDANQVVKRLRYASPAPAIQFATGSRGWIIQNNQLLRTTDGGRQWQKVVVPGTEKL